VGLNYNRDVRLLALFPAEVSKKLSDYFMARDGTQPSTEGGEPQMSARSRDDDDDDDEDGQDKTNNEDMKVVF
jgi:hypothetical protein